VRQRQRGCVPAAAPKAASACNAAALDSSASCGRPEKATPLPRGWVHLLGACCTYPSAGEAEPLPLLLSPPEPALPPEP